MLLKPLSSCDRQAIGTDPSERTYNGLSLEDSHRFSPFNCVLKGLFFCKSHSDPSLQPWQNKANAPSAGLPPPREGGGHCLAVRNGKILLGGRDRKTEISSAPRTAHPELRAVMPPWTAGARTVHYSPTQSFSSCTGGGTVAVVWLYLGIAE